MGNVFIKKQTSSAKIKDHRSDSKVRSILEVMKEAQCDVNRQYKKTNIEEDVNLKRDFHAPLPSGRPPLMKSSLYAIASRKIKVKGVRTPKFITEGTSVQDQLATEFINEGLDEINFNRQHKKTYDKYETEGTGILVIREIDGELKPTMVAFEDFLIDPNATELEEEWKGESEGNARWFAFRERFKRNTFDKVYPKWADKVSSGSPLTDDDTSALSDKGVVEHDESIEECVEIWHIFSLLGEEPMSMSIAGGSATIIEELKGSNYKYRAGNGQPFLPVFLFSLSDEKIGLWSASLVGFVKDGSELIKKAWNATVRNALRIADAPTYMFGSVDETDVHEMVNYYQQAEMGYTPIIQRADPNISIQTVAPQDVSATFANIKANVFDDLSERLGFQLRRHEDNPQMKVSIYVRQEQDEGDAVKAIDRRNEDVYKRLFLCVFWMKRSLAPYKKRKLKVEGLDEIDLKAKDVREILKDYEPKIIVDTDMDLQLSFQERIQASDIIATDLINLYATNIQDPVVAESVAKLKYEKAVRFGLARQVKKEDFIAAATVEPPIQPEIPEMPAAESMQMEGKEAVSGEPKAFNNLGL